MWYKPRPMPLVPPYVASLTPYVPGKPIEEVEREYGVSNVAKLASNENALGPSPRALAAARAAAAEVNLYPDGSAFHLRNALAAKLGVEPREVFVGNGSNELIELMVRTFVLEGEEVLTSAQSFVAYKLAAQEHGRKLVEAPMKARFHYDLDAIKKLLSRRTKVVFLANPDNPNGTYFGAAELDLYADGTHCFANGTFDGCTTDKCIAWGGDPSDVPVLGDWDGSGRLLIGVYRATTGWWYLDANATREVANAKALEFLTGYLVEKALAVDNIFVFLMVFTYFAVPPEFQKRVLMIGILGALVLRAGMILVGAWLIQQFDWVLYIFGAFLVFTGVKLLFSRAAEPHPERSAAFRALRRVVPASASFDGHRFFTIEDGRRVATPLFFALVVIELTDVVFAVDSIPAIFAVTRDPFIVFTSNIFAILGLRSLYFLLASFDEKFVYLKPSLAFVLAFVGAKMTLVDVVKIHPAASLGVVLAIVGGLRPGGGGGNTIEPRELAKFGAEHAVVLRQPARIVALHVDDMAVLNAH